MTEKYSIAEARNRFAELVHLAEDNQAVEISRRGEVVAVLISRQAYQKLTGQIPNFWKAVSEFRAEYNVEGLGIDPEIFNVRPVESGRDVAL